MYTHTELSVKDLLFIDLAAKLGELGTCDRAYVGAIILKEGRAISWGYNGALPGQPHCEDNYHGYADGYADVPGRFELALRKRGCRNVVHAEANAICFAARQGISTDGCTLYTERSPCESCARLIVSAGIVRVVYRHRYRDQTGVEILQKAMVLCDSEN